MTAVTRLARSGAGILPMAAVAAVFGVSAPDTVFAQSGQKPAPSSQRPAQRQAPAAGQPSAPQPNQPAQQPSQGPNVVALKPAPTQTEWTKVCAKDQKGTTELCYTTRDFVTEQGQVAVSAAVYDAKGPKPEKTVRFIMSFGLLIQPGIRFAVDQGQAISGKFSICLPNGCFAEAPVKDDFVNALKKGTTLNISAQNAPGRVVTFAVPAAGFAKAFDGAPIDPKVLQEKQKQALEEAARRREELRKQLQGSSGTPQTSN